MLKPRGTNFLKNMKRNYILIFIILVIGESY